MSFFESLPEPPPQPAPQRQPPWFSPPGNELGVGVPVRVMLVRTESLALSVGDVVAYTTGFMLRLALRFRPGGDEDPRTAFMQLHPRPGTPPEEILRFGVEFSDGRRAAGFGPGRPPPVVAPPISLMRRGGGGGGDGAFDTSYWVFPLPPPGPLTLAAEWPARGIALVTQQIDGSAIADAGARSELLWEDDRPFGGGGPPPTPGVGPGSGFSAMYTTQQQRSGEA
jgi:hypothetical protein